MIRKLNLAGEELEFKITNKTIFKLDELYGNFGEVINGVMQSNNLYNNSARVVACACITREVIEEELKNKLTAEQITQELVPFAIQLYLDYMGVKENNKQTELEPEKKTSMKSHLI